MAQHHCHQSLLPSRERERERSAACTPPTSGSNTYRLHLHSSLLTAQSAWHFSSCQLDVVLSTYCTHSSYFVFIRDIQTLYQQMETNTTHEHRHVHKPRLHFISSTTFSLHFSALPISPVFFLLHFLSHRGSEVLQHNQSP